jgi:hypothetical protein
LRPPFVRSQMAAATCAYWRNFARLSNLELAPSGVHVCCITLCARITTGTREPGSVDAVDAGKWYLDAVRQPAEAYESELIRPAEAAAWFK